MTDLTTTEIVVIRNLVNAAEQLANSPRLQDAPIITQPVKEAAEAVSDIFKNQIFKGLDFQEALDTRIMAMDSGVE